MKHLNVHLAIVIDCIKVLCGINLSSQDCCSDRGSVASGRKGERHASRPLTAAATVGIYDFVSLNGHIWRLYRPVATPTNGHIVSLPFWP